MWLNRGLHTVKLVFVFMPLLAPVTTYAGVFSFFSDLIDNKEANASVVSSSQVTGVLEAKVGPGSAAPMGGAEISMAGGALIQESGVNGTQADLSPTQKSTQISLYVVRQGDSLSQIADMFGVSVNTIVWANNIKGSIKEGDELVILPVTGVSHKIAKGDTLRSIAAKYKADMDDIRSYNDLDVDGVLAVGSVVIIPDGEVAKVSAAASSDADKIRSASGPAYKDYYLRPIAGGVKSQNLHGYNGVDLAAPLGTPIYASAPGVVIVARPSGYNGGYGSYVVISHPNGTQTLYAHASRVLVEQGQTVDRGDTIALLGSTGKSTGPHVHFEIRGATNPF